jgi:hypothetical protein
LSTPLAEKFFWEAKYNCAEAGDIVKIETANKIKDPGIWKTPLVFIQRIKGLRIGVQAVNQGINTLQCQKI